jgi:UDP-3-O-acyl N-acetylglucosamine deacetylase
MDPSLQHTVGKSVTAAGIALHTGKRVHATIHPAPINHGIRFRRIDLPGTPVVHAHANNVTETRRGTTISQNGGTIHTVEHLLAAFHALQIDNALVDLLGPEPPVMDGSSLPFIEIVQEAGIVDQEAPAAYIEAKSPIFMEAGGTKMVVLPDPQFRISCTVKYDCNLMDCQYLELVVTAESFIKQLQGARTFCLEKEIQFLMASNLIIGGSLDNAVVIQENAILSKDGLRYPDEFVRHKMLDIVGDIFLVGARFRGHIIAIKPGHPANVALAQEILKQQ